MFEHVLVAVDFSPAWPHLEARLHMLHELGTRRATLVHVLSTRYPAVPAETHRPHYEARLHELAEELAAADVAIDVQVRSGEPGYELTQAARELQADLILAGMTGHTAVHDFLLGSTVLDLARLTQTPLWLDPIAEAHKPTELRSVLLATDGSTAAAQAEDVLIALVPKATSAIALQVISSRDEREQEIEARDAQDHLGKLTQRADGLDVRVQTGDPATLIVETADATNADLIILGKRGRSTLRDLLLGSTVETVCRHSRRPILVVPQLHRSSAAG